MNRVEIEQAKVFQYLKGINPSTKGNYDEMLRLISQDNQKSGVAPVPEETKRIMYLQLIAHSVQESCQTVISEVEDEGRVEEINRFHRQVTSFCRSFLAKQEWDDFNELQERQSHSFAKEWGKIVEEMERPNLMIQ